MALVGHISRKTAILSNVYDLADKVCLTGYNFLGKSVDFFLAGVNISPVFQKGNRETMGRRRITRHHRFPESRCPEFGLNPNDPRNLKMMPEPIQRAFHRIFDNLTPEESIKRLVLEWFPSPEYFGLTIIKNKNLRAYCRSVWDEKNRKIVAQPVSKCGKCGGKLVPTDKINGVFEFNCENCGQNKCYACILCKKVATMEVDSDKKLFICGHCLINVIKKGAHLPNRYRQYLPVLKKIYLSRTSV